MTSLLARSEWARSGAPAAARARCQCGIPLRAVAAGTGVTYTTVWKWETGKTTPNGPAGAAYLRVIAGLKRHLEIPEEQP